MAITEEARYKAYQAIKAAHGDEVANVLFEMLPPVGWADVATKHDLAALEERLGLRFQIAGNEINGVEARLRSEMQIMEARMGERLERAMRTQLTRFTAALVTTFTAFGLIDRLVLG